MVISGYGWGEKIYCRYEGKYSRDVGGVQRREKVVHWTWPAEWTWPFGWGKQERKTKEKTKLSTCLKWKGFNRKLGGRKAHKLERFRVGTGWGEPGPQHRLCYRYLWRWESLEASMHFQMLISNTAVNPDYLLDLRIYNLLIHCLIIYSCYYMLS